MTAVHDLEIDDAFERTYTLEWLVDLPNSTIPRHYLPDGVPNSGPTLRVTSEDGQKFLVIIAGEARGFKIQTWPNAASFLALPSGALVDSAAPEKSQQLPGFCGHSVHYVFPLPQHNAILVGHCCGLYCYDGEGIRWSHDDLFCCEDPVLDVVGDVLHVTAHKHGVDPGDTPTVKRLDLKTGKQLD